MNAASHTQETRQKSTVRLSHRQRAEETEAVKRILRPAFPSVPLRDLKISRPAHHVSWWRAVVCWVMHERLSVPMATLAHWFGLTPLGVQRAIERAQKAYAEDSAVRSELDLAAERAWSAYEKEKP